MANSFRNYLKRRREFVLSSVTYIFSGQQASDETMDLTAGLNVLTPPETPTRPDLMAAGTAALHQDLSGNLI
jgi:hypothetical protein